MGKIEIIQGNICEQRVDAIVNAANTDLLHGGGVAEAIVDKGGSIIQEESNSIAPIALGEAAVTSAGKLDAKYIIHAASMRLGDTATEESAKNSIFNSFKRAEELEVKSIAFPAVAAGVARLPVEKCAQISIQLAKDFSDKFDTIRFVLLNEKVFSTFVAENNKKSESQPVDSESIRKQ